MVKALNITISDRNFIFCFAYLFVRASVHVYFDIFKSPVFLELGTLMSHDDSTALLLVSGDEANSVNCLRKV